MTSQHRVEVIIVLILVPTSPGCEQRIDVATYATHQSYENHIQRDDLPAATRVLYDALLDGNLLGAQAAEFQELLDTAQRITDKGKVVWYEFQLTSFDRQYEHVIEEGVPFLYVKVQKKYGHIYRCDVAAPEF